MKKGNPDPNSQAWVLFISGSGGGATEQTRRAWGPLVHTVLLLVFSRVREEGGGKSVKAMDVPSAQAPSVRPTP